MTDIQRELGAHEARLDHIERRLETIDSKLDRVVIATERVRGGWQVLVSVGGIAGAVGAGIVKLITYLKGGS